MTEIPFNSSIDFLKTGMIWALRANTKSKATAPLKNLTAVVYYPKLHLNSQAVRVNQWRLPVNAPTLNAGVSIAGDFDNCLYNCSALELGSSPEVITGLRQLRG